MPNTVSTPSAFRHSMIASTARTASNLPRPARHENLVREVEVAAAAHADLVAQSHHVPAFLATPPRLLVLPAVEDPDECDPREDRARRPRHEGDDADHELPQDPAGDEQHYQGQELAAEVG